MSFTTILSCTIISLVYLLQCAVHEKQCAAEYLMQFLTKLRVATQWNNRKFKHIIDAMVNLNTVMNDLTLTSDDNQAVIMRWLKRVMEMYSGESNNTIPEPN
jgi:hypothetical protein